MKRARNITILFYVCNEFGLPPTEIIAQIEKIHPVEEINLFYQRPILAAVVFSVRLSAQADIIIANKSDNKEI